MLLLNCVDLLSVGNISEAGVASSPTTGSKVKTIDGGHKMVTGQLLPNTLLSRSATEFDLECETGAVYEKAVKRVRPDDNSAGIISGATDSMSDGILVAAAASLNSVDDEADITDTSTALDSSTAVAMRVCTEDVMKQRKNYSTKASRIICMQSVNLIVAYVVGNSTCGY